MTELCTQPAFWHQLVNYALLHAVFIAGAFAVKWALKQWINANAVRLANFEHARRGCEEDCEHLPTLQGVAG